MTLDSNALEAAARTAAPGSQLAEAVEFAEPIIAAYLSALPAGEVDGLARELIILGSEIAPHHGEQAQAVCDGAASTLTSLSARIEALEAENERAHKMLARLYQGYVNTLETGRDRIIFLGGSCDPVDVMEAGDPVLIAARAALSRRATTGVGEHG